MRWVVLFLIAVLLLVASPTTQAKQDIGQRILQQRTVVLSLRGSAGSASCLGFRLYRDDFPPDMDLILTAAHCVTDLGSSLSASVSTLDGLTGRAVYWVFWRDADVALIVVTPRLGPIDPIREFWNVPPERLPVLAMIVVGGGRPTLTSGLVLGFDGTNVQLLLPGAPGSSGGGVVDFSGSLVGMIASGRSVARGAAGFLTEAVGAGLVTRLHNQEREKLALAARERSRVASPLPVAPSPPSPALPPSPPPPPPPAQPPAPSSPGVRGQPAFDNRIVAGERISGITLRMTINQALAAAIVTFGSGAATATQCTNMDEYRKLARRGWTSCGLANAHWKARRGNSQRSRHNASCTQERS